MVGGPCARAHPDTLPPPFSPPSAVLQAGAVDLLLGFVHGQQSWGKLHTAPPGLPAQRSVRLPVCVTTRGHLLSSLVLFARAHVSLPTTVCVCVCSRSGRPVIMNVWVPITDATLDNGCMYVLPKASAFTRS